MNNSIIIIVISAVIYYIGLMYLTYSAFKKKKIKLSWFLKFFIPFFILKTYLLVAFRYRKDTKILKHSVLELLLGYSNGLAILVEIVRFGFDNGYISSETRERKNISTLISKVRETFSSSLDEYLAY
ncbi:hypothetical protein [Enterococcus hirae]|uniref:hypothetical protein n=1 Tax=Enterococcus hirae TaxID=1354 RepID=UPI002EB792C2|nr:hypothetical protein [Enterococcus hirae]EMF0297528.1 hypothetical protein [Enterococcus hirae]